MRIRTLEERQAEAESIDSWKLALDVLVFIALSAVVAAIVAAAIYGGQEVLP